MDCQSEYQRIRSSTHNHNLMTQQEPHNNDFEIKTEKLDIKCEELSNSECEEHIIMNTQIKIKQENQTSIDADISQGDEYVNNRQLIEEGTEDLHNVDDNHSEQLRDYRSNNPSFEFVNVNHMNKILITGDNKIHENKATRKRITLETKMQVLRRIDSGERQSEIGVALNLSTSTIRTILKNKEKIVSSATTTTATSATRITRSRNNTIEEMEKRLSKWIDDEIERNMPLNQAIIMEKARKIFNHIQVETDDTSETFVASRGWFYRFKHRKNLHSIQITGKAASVDKKAVAEFPAKLKTIIERGNYPSELVFNVDETGLFWKRMPKRTFISREEKPAPKTGLDEGNVQDLEEILQETAESLSNDELKELADQEQKNNESSDSEEVQKELSTEFLKTSLTTITDIMDQFIENDTDFDRSSKARQGVMDALSTYRQLLTERKRKTQMTLDNFSIKRKKIGNAEESE